jgi:glutamyl-Q tRNA(Asp) synthetase
MMTRAWTTRFAPSPTGRLHLGHAYAAWFAWQRAGESGGRFLLRIEDLDGTRARPEFTAAILDDLRWLGLGWDGPVPRQSERGAAYQAALDRLRAAGLVYPCFCTRAEIQREIARIGGAPQGETGPPYPGTCRALDPAARADRLARGDGHAWRLDLAAARRRAGPLRWHDRRRGWQEATLPPGGDPVLARKDAPGSYHLAVVVDDAWQEITLVTRGEDLFAATHLHRLLQALLDLPEPAWEHHPLVCDAAGRRLAKRDHDTGLDTLRAAGLGPAAVLERARAMV